MRKSFRGLAPTVTEDRIRVATAVWTNKSPLHIVESYKRDGITFIAFVDANGSTKAGEQFMIRQGIR